MAYELNRYGLFENVCNHVINTLDVQPYLVYIDMVKYIDNYHNLKIKVYVVLDSDNFVEFDDKIDYDNSIVHIKTIKLNQLLGIKRYKVSMLLSNITNSIAVINNKNINDILVKLMNAITPLEILEDLQCKVNSIANFINEEKEFNADNKVLVARAIKFINLFTNIYESFDIYNSYNKTAEMLSNSEVILHLMNNTPILELVNAKDLEKAAQNNKFENLKSQINNSANFINSVMNNLSKQIQDNT